jgi:hypothetical protein
MIIDAILANPMPLLILAIIGVGVSGYLLGTQHAAAPALPQLCEREHVEQTVDPYESVAIEHVAETELVEQITQTLTLEPLLSTDERVELVAQALWEVDERSNDDEAARTWAKLRSKRVREFWRIEARQLLERLHLVK